MMPTLMSALSGINLVHDCRYLASGIAGSLKMAVIYDKVVSIASRIVRGIYVTEETLAMDMMREVSPKVSFLPSRHTARFVKSEIFIPRLFDKSSIVSGLKLVGKTLRERPEKERWRY